MVRHNSCIDPHSMSLSQCAKPEFVNYKWLLQENNGKYYIPKDLRAMYNLADNVNKQRSFCQMKQRSPAGSRQSLHVAATRDSAIFSSSKYDSPNSRKGSSSLANIPKSFSVEHRATFLNASPTNQGSQQKSSVAINRQTLTNLDSPTKGTFNIKLRSLNNISSSSSRAPGKAPKKQLEDMEKIKKENRQKFTYLFGLNRQDGRFAGPAGKKFSKTEDQLYQILFQENKRQFENCIQKQLMDYDKNKMVYRQQLMLQQ